jgi:cell division protein FtsQ
MKVRKKRSRLVISQLIIRVMIVLCIFILITSVFFVLNKKRKVGLLPLKQIVFVGNKHLSDSELTQIAGIKRDVSLISISNVSICKKLLSSPWIKAVKVRKELPYKLTIIVKEAEPFAILDMRDKFFLVDEEGNLLEELKGRSVPFLPVIAGDPYKEKDAFLEAIQLAKAVKKKGFMDNRESVEIIADKLNELSLVVDGLHVKIGPYDYENKLDHFLQLESFIKSEDMNIEYVDLRFKKRAYVKPVINEGKSEKQ